MATDFRPIGNTLISAGDKQIVTGNKLKAYSTDFSDFGEFFNNGGQIDTPLEQIKVGIRDIREFFKPIGGNN